MMAAGTRVLEDFCNNFRILPVAHLGSAAGRKLFPLTGYRRSALPTTGLQPHELLDPNVAATGGAGCDECPTISAALSGYRGGKLLVEQNDPRTAV